MRANLKLAAFAATGILAAGATSCAGGIQHAVTSAATKTVTVTQTQAPQTAEQTQTQTPSTQTQQPSCSIRGATVMVVSGGVSCSTAQSILNQYVHGQAQPKLAEFPGYLVADWICFSGTFPPGMSDTRQSDCYRGQSAAFMNQYQGVPDYQVPLIPARFTDHIRVAVQGPQVPNPNS